MKRLIQQYIEINGKRHYLTGQFGRCMYLFHKMHLRPVDRKRCRLYWFDNSPYGITVFGKH